MEKCTRSYYFGDDDDDYDDDDDDDDDNLTNTYNISILLGAKSASCENIGKIETTELGKKYSRENTEKTDHRHAPILSCSKKMMMVAMITMKVLRIFNSSTKYIVSCPTR